MFKFVKSKLYFFVAYYFRVFAQIQLALWKPRVIVITGSSGKTTLLHLIESQIKGRARYSHHANSAYGVPFDILGLKRTNFKITEWLYLFLVAPVKAFKKPFKEKLYIVEADCDRPGEGKFLASLLKPEITLWTGISRTHSMNFDKLVKEKKFAAVEQAIAHEFGYFLEYTTGLGIVNGDNNLTVEQCKRLKTSIIQIKKAGQLGGYKVSANSTQFKIKNVIYDIACLLPEEVFYSIAQTLEVLDYLHVEPDATFSNFVLPPGRNSILKGIKNTVIIDSSYNATLDGMAVILKMFAFYPTKVKWAVLGDMLEQGKQEQEEHERLAEMIAGIKLDKIILMGPRVSKYTYPKLKLLLPNAAIECFELPKQTLNYIQSHIFGGETILFKGARFLEGIIEHLLLDKNDAGKLCRREQVWQNRRKEWGL